MKRLLLLPALLAAAAAIALALNTAASDRTDDVTSALFEADVNEGMADSAPQQQVVNGWVAKDLLEIQARQLDDLAGAQRTQTIVIALVGLTAVLAIGATVSSRPATNPIVLPSLPSPEAAPPQTDA